MREMPNRHTKTRLDVHQQGRSYSNIWLSILPQISHYIQYCILDLDTEHKTDAWGLWYKDLSINMPNLLLLLRKNSSPVISKMAYLTDLRVEPRPLRSREDAEVTSVATRYLQ